MASSLLISFEYIQLGLRLRKCLSPPMYIIPSRWRLIILQQGVWEVAPVSELSVEAVLIKLHTAGKGPPTDTALLTLHLRTKRKNTQPELLLWTIHSVWRFTPFNYFHNNNPMPSQRLCQRYGVSYIITHPLKSSNNYPPLPFLHSGQQDLFMGKWHQWTVSEFQTSSSVHVNHKFVITALLRLFIALFWQYVKGKKV